MQQNSQEIARLQVELEKGKSDMEHLHVYISQLKQKMARLNRDKEETEREMSRQLLEQQQTFEVLLLKEREQLKTEASIEIQGLKNMLAGVQEKQKLEIQKEVQRVQIEMGSILDEERQQLKKHMIQSIAKLKESFQKGNFQDKTQFYSCFPVSSLQILNESAKK